MQGNTLLVLLIVAWAGQAFTFLPLSRTFNSKQGLNILLLLAVGQLFSSSLLSLYHCWSLAVSAPALLTGLLHSLTWLSVLPAVLMCGVAPAVTLTSLLSVVASWLVIRVCGQMEVLVSDPGETIDLSSVLLMVVLAGAGAVCATVITAHRVDVAGTAFDETQVKPTAALLPLPSRLPSQLNGRSGPSHILLQRCRAISFESSSRSPELSSSPLRINTGSVSVHTEQHRSSTLQSTLYLDCTDDSVDSGGMVHCRQQTGDQWRQQHYDTIARETVASDWKEKELGWMRSTSSRSVITMLAEPIADACSTDATIIVSSTKLLPSESAFCVSAISLRLSTSPNVRLAVACISCVCSAAFSAVYLLPLYAVNEFGMERQAPMGEHILGKDAAMVAALILARLTHSLLTQRDNSLSPPSSLITSVADSSIPLLHIAAVGPAIASSTSSVLFTNLRRLSSSFSFSHLFVALLYLLCGCPSSLSFYYFHDVLQHYSSAANFGWYFFSFANDHYLPLTVLVQAAITSAVVESDGAWQRWSGRWRREEQRRIQAEEEMGESAAPKVCSFGIVSLWVMSLLLGSLGNFVIISNGLQRV